VYCLVLKFFYNFSLYVFMFMSKITEVDVAIWSLDEHIGSSVACVDHWEVWRATLDPHSYNDVRKLCESEASVVRSSRNVNPARTCLPSHLSFQFRQSSSTLSYSSSEYALRNTCCVSGITITIITFFNLLAVLCAAYN